MSDCLFCGIVEGRVKGDVVYRDESVVAFRDIRPKAPVHILIIPRKHVATILDLEANDQAVVGQIFSCDRKTGARAGYCRERFPCGRQIQELTQARLFFICIFICWADVTLVGLRGKEPSRNRRFDDNL